MTDSASPCILSIGSFHSRSSSDRFINLANVIASALSLIQLSSQILHQITECNPRMNSINLSSRKKTTNSSISETCNFEMHGKALK
ncbi:hypothetical protein RB195_011091 [Necator americanus]|uniref:Uncharacterized protein n=1 Tax=Necator americanus TaxID=51031 RepID=A0ABR1D428_NECAM